MRLDSINKMVVVKIIIEGSTSWGGWIVKKSNRGFRS